MDSVHLQRLDRHWCHLQPTIVPTLICARTQYYTAGGVPFYINSPIRMLQKCLASPGIAQLLHRCPVIPKGELRFISRCIHTCMAIEVYPFLYADRSIMLSVGEMIRDFTHQWWKRTLDSSLSESLSSLKQMMDTNLDVFSSFFAKVCFSILMHTYNLLLCACSQHAGGNRRDVCNGALPGTCYKPAGQLLAFRRAIH